MKKKWYRRRKRLLEILEVGNDLDHVSRAYDFISAFAIILNLTASIMYTFDNLQAQPDVFHNAFSGVWWAASTLLTVGYGDVYPVTTLGKVFSIFITFLGVGMVAIPTGIISAGFIDQYSRIKRRNEYGYEADLLVLGAEPYEDDEHINLKEVVLKPITHGPDYVSGIWTFPASPLSFWSSVETNP